MAELARSVGAAGVWLTLLALITACVNARRRRPLLDPSGLLVSYCLFFLFQVVAVKALDLVGLLVAPALAVVYAAGLVVAAAALRSWREDRARVVPDPEWTGPDERLVGRIAITCAVVACAALAVFSFFVPPHVWDVQAYHMPMVASYVQNESLAVWPAQDLRQVFRVNAGELQMLNLALLSRSDALVELPNIVGLGVCLVATFRLAVRTLGRRTLAYLSVVIVLTAPQMLYGSVTAKNDLMFTALLLCCFHGVVCLARPGGASAPAGDDVGRSDRDLPAGSAILLLAIATALAGATKVLGLNVAGTVGLGLLALVLAKRVSTGQLALFGAATLVVLLALVGDVLLRNTEAAAIPVGIRPGEVHWTFGLPNLLAAARFYVYDLSFKRLVTPQIFEHDFMHYGYLFPFLLTLGTAAGIRQVRASRREPGLAMLSMLTVVLFASVIIARLSIQWDQRFMIWMVPVFTVLALSFASRVGGRSLVAATSFAAAIAFVNIATLYTNASDGLFARSATFTAERGRLPGLVDLPPWKYDFRIDGYAELSRAAAPEDSILYVGAEDTWMYPVWGPRFTRRVEGVSDPAHAAARVASREYAYIVIEDNAEARIRDGVCRAARRNGYGVLVRAEGREILSRAPATVEPGAAAGAGTTDPCFEPDEP